MSRSRLAPLSLVAVSALALAGCASASGDGADDGVVRVVASTDVYGQIAEEIGGDAVQVTSIVTSGAQDPHSFEPSAQDQLAVSRADLILENGGGYDGFIDALVESSGVDAPVLTAAEFSHDWPGNAGHEAEAAHTDEADDEHTAHDHGDHAHVEGFNEHVWYDPDAMAHFAEAIADELTALDPDGAEEFAANLEEFEAGTAQLDEALAAVAETDAGAEVFVTEPVALYLVAAAGLENVTPDAFTEAVEEGQDVPPSTLLEALRLLEDGDVRVVIANAQTGGPETEGTIRAAESAGIPVVEFAETLPEGQTYLSWMDENVAALTDALSR
ncbi:metal ABC transporter substrate-binding protein [Microbacterium lushaniae]|uniref:Metal ABC transporter substrate-binding protein n=1 Tax=Microbacterium lushaniae TaxID=2614639 RepID=A0A5J6L8D3_9MICO|nr:zinc ABC transporter substrate-binding protein [Microbacterium lushaniae]QEW04671.1 metal ABC transporter substrate-binding protein [Microbacterium lushaniae]